MSLEVNTLVRHKKLKSLGIGCVSRVLSKSVKVNFGTDDNITCKLDAVEIVDTSGCTELAFAEFRRLGIANSPDLPGKVIIGNEVKHYVGIGWISDGVVTMDDLKKYPRLVE